MTSAERNTATSEKGNRHGNVDDFLTIKESSTVKETSISREKKHLGRVSRCRIIYILQYIYIYIFPI